VILQENNSKVINGSKVVTTYRRKNRINERKMLNAVAESIFEPGVNSQLLKVVNITFICLILVGIGLIFLAGFNIHLIVLLVLSSGLLFSINW
jgi:hypothetical protein